LLLMGGVKRGETATAFTNRLPDTFSLTTLKGISETNIFDNRN